MAGMGTPDQSKSGSVFLGYKAGYNETNDNRLYIENTNSGFPLIYGEFDSDILAFNAEVGIGTMAPEVNLDIKSSSTDLTSRIRLSNSDNSRELRLSSGNDTYNPSISFTGGDALRFMRYDGGYHELMRITSDGKIGIGITDPFYNLEIMSSSTDQTSKIRLSNSDNSKDLRLSSGSDVHDPHISFAGGEALRFMRYDGGYNELMRITGDGNVGIGTDNPSANLHVSGNEGVIIDGDLVIGAGSADDNDYIWFDDSNESLYWDEDKDRFAFSDHLAVYNAVQSGYSGPAILYNQMGGGTTSNTNIASSSDLFITDDLEIGDELYVQGDIILQGEITGTELFSSEAITDDPGVANRAEDFFLKFISEGDGIVQLVSRTLTTPGPGYVLVIGTCYFDHWKVGWNNEVNAVIGVSDVNNAFPPSQEFEVNVSNNVNFCEYPITIHGLFEVQTAGAKTFYFLAENTSNTGGNVSIALMLPENKYAMISANRDVSKMANNDV